MKKNLIVSLLFAISSLQLWAADSTAVSYSARQGFAKQFPGIIASSWSPVQDYYVASFSINGEKRNAYFASDGELVAESREVYFSNLPLTIQTSLANRFPQQSGYSFVDVDNENGLRVIEVNDTELGVYYVVKVKNQNTSLYVKASGYGELVIQRKVKNKV